MPSIDGRLLSGLEVLGAVVQTGNFARAAEVLGLSRPGVSRAVARLEERVGVRLFDRNPRVVKLTQEGRRFYERVSPMLASIEEAAGEAGGAANQVRGRLRINVDPFFARLLLLPKLQGFLSAHPLLTLELLVRDGVEDLVEDGFDLAVRFGEPDRSSLRVRKLLETRIATCASPAYLRAHPRPRRPQDLANGAHACIHFRDPRTGRPFDWEFHQGRKRVKVSVTGQLVVNDAAFGLEACIAGLGIAQPMGLGLAPLLKSGALVELFPSWGEERFPLYAIYPSRSFVPAKVRAFLDFVIALAK